MSSTAIFKRPDLAERLADQVLQEGGISAAPSGIFLAAPRRTGKSTFIRTDLTPALTERGANVLYVDLWADRTADPADVLMRALRTELARHANVLKRLAERLGIVGGKVSGIDFALDRIGLGKDVSIAKAMAALSDEVRSPIVLIIDEAQHALTTAAGIDSLFALKAARDELNSSSHFGLRLVCTGSSRDKLAMLRNSKDQAFFGAPMVEFPHLDQAFVGWFCANVGLPVDLDPAEVSDLFAAAEYRPEVLAAAADAVRFDLSLQPHEVPARFARAINEQIEASKQEIVRVVHALTPIQRAVLVVLIEQGSDYRPFEAATLGRYRAQMDKSEEGVDLSATAVQNALGALQKAGLVWRADRGVYALEEPSLQEVLRGAAALDRTAGASQH